MEKGFSRLEYTNSGDMHRNFISDCAVLITLFCCLRRQFENHKTVDVAKAYAVPYSNKYDNNDVYNIGCV